VELAQPRAPGPEIDGITPAEPIALGKEPLEARQKTRGGQRAQAVARQIRALEMRQPAQAAVALSCFILTRIRSM
jgi:hypothetical protein